MIGAWEDFLVSHCKITLHCIKGRISKPLHSTAQGKKKSCRSQTKQKFNHFKLRGGLKKSKLEETSFMAGAWGTF